MSNIITIDLDSVGNSTIANNGVIQIDARKRLLEELYKTEKIGNRDNEPDATSSASGKYPQQLQISRSRRHNTILVSGRRGEGKTTFLSNILTHIENEKYIQEAKSNSDHPAEKLPALFSLGIIDPTLIETKQNIMIVVIDRIHLATKHRNKQRGDDHVYKNVAAALRKLAQGLSLLDGIGENHYYGKDWLDADFVLDKGLDDASAAHDFERRFHEFVREAAKYLSIDAFVLAIDDVDTWFERGWPVLEALRKYLVTPQLRIILSGDLNLYALLVRRQQWLQMGKEFLDAERQRSESFKHQPNMQQNAVFDNIGAMVDQLQDQYLIKIAPPENRIELRPLAYYSARNTVKITAKGLESKDTDKNLEVKDFIKRMAERVLAMRYTQDHELVAQQLLRLPARSVLQVLKGAIDICKSLEAKSTNESARQDAQDALMHVAWTAAMSLGLNVEKTRDATPQTIFGILSEWLTASNTWSTLARFYPDAADAEDRNITALYLSAVLQNIFAKSPGKMLEYWLKIALIKDKALNGDLTPDGPRTMRELQNHLLSNTVSGNRQFIGRLSAWEAVERKENTKLIDLSIRLSGIKIPMKDINDRNPVTRELYGLAYSRDAYLDRAKFLDILHSSDKEVILNALPAPLKGYHAALAESGIGQPNEDRTTTPYLLYFANGIDYLAKNLDPESKLLARIPANGIVSAQGSVHGNYSVLQLIAIISEMTDLLGTGKADKKSDILSILQNIPQIVNFPTSVAVNAGVEENNDDTDEVDNELLEDYSDETAGEHENIVNALNNWLLSHSAKQPLSLSLSPVVLARIWTRFTSTYDRIIAGLEPGKSRYLGVIMHRSILAFLHAVGFEAMRATNIRMPVSLATNPVESGQVLLRLLKTIYNEADDIESSKFQQTDEFAFFNLLFTCPLWAYFLARKETDELGKERRSKPNDAIFEIYELKTGEFWDQLNKKIPTDIVTISKGDKTAKFDSLFFPLNSVPILGYSKKYSGANLAKIIKEQKLNQNTSRSRRNKDDIEKQIDPNNSNDPNDQGE